MDATHPDEPLRARPIAFLVSTTPCARDIRGHLGDPAYSYAFVRDMLAPVLDAIGRWESVDPAPSRLALAAERAACRGERPIHLAINPLQDVYLTPAVPTVVFPFWEFPDLPDRPLGHDGRHDWTRIAGRADAVVTACRFTADAFERAGVDVPVHVVPVPLDPAAFDLPPWDPSHAWSLDCRHEVWEGDPEPASEPAATPAPSNGTGEPLGLRRRVVRAVFRRVYPWLGPRALGTISRARFVYHLSRQMPPKRLAFLLARDAYRRRVRPWLSNHALERINQAKRRTWRLIGRDPDAPEDPPLPTATLSLSGLVYTTMFNVGDPRKNPTDLLSAFLTAFRDRPDVTLVIKLVSGPRRERDERNHLRYLYDQLGIEHRCRVAVVTEFLTEEQLAGLYRATTYYVNTSHAEGACLPLQEALAGGRPAIAPDHTAMADYIDDSVGFPIRSHAEPAPWPHDPEQRLSTTRRRLVWADLVAAFLRSAEVAETDPGRYAALSSAARARMAAYAAQPVAEDALRRAVADLHPGRPMAALGWAS